MNGRVFFGFMLIVVGVVVLFILALTLINRSGDDNDAVADSPESSITDHVNDRSTAVYERRGPIIADEEHEGYRIEITQSTRTVEVYQGYDKQVVTRQTFGNTEEAYEEFIYALARTGFSGTPDEDESETRGICADGLLDTYTFSEGSETVAYQWVTNCGLSTTNTRGLEDLFISQIPEFRDITADVRL